MSFSNTDHSTFIKKISENKSQEDWKKLLKEKQEEINKLKKAVEKATVLVVPHENFFEYLEIFSGRELAGKTIPLDQIVIGTRGEIIKKENLVA